MIPAVAFFIVPPLAMEAFLLQMPRFLATFFAARVAAQAVLEPASSAVMFAMVVVRAVTASASFIPVLGSCIHPDQRS